MSARHRQAKKRAAQLALLGKQAASVLAVNLAAAGALCAAYREGRRQEWRRLTVSPGWIWEPGCHITVRP